VDFLHQKLDFAHFRESTDSQLGGLPLLLELWNQLVFSILPTQCGIFKVRGLAAWKLAFAFAAAPIGHCASDRKRLEFWNQDALLQTSLQFSVVTQSVPSRFLNCLSQGPAFNLSRIRQLQTDPQYALADGDVIALGDTPLPHQLRLWVSMDRWFFRKSFCLKLAAMELGWVAKAKRKTVFYRKTPHKNGKPRFTRVTTREILCQAYAQMPQTQDAQPNCLVIPNLYGKTMEPNPEALDLVRLHFPIRVRKLASFFKRYRPRQITLNGFDPLPDCKCSPASG
jgi:hypothetical protein